MLVSVERGKPKNPEKSLGKGREPTTNLIHVWNKAGIEPGRHWLEANALNTAPSLPHNYYGN